MPYANNNGVKIYYEVEGDGPPLVLAHGGGSELNGWRRFGYADALKNDYQLILFDARGHGRSDKPHRLSDYGPRMADDVLAVLDDLGVERACFLGYFTGALTGLLLATHHAERFYGFIIGCMSPYGFPEDMVIVVNNAIRELKLYITDPEGVMQRREQRLGRVLTPAERDIDAEAMIGVLTAQLDVRFAESELASISVPFLVYCGDADPFHADAKESANHIPQAKFVSLPGLGHGQGWSRSDVTLPHIKEFLARVSKSK